MLELDEIEVVELPAGHPLNSYLVDVQLIRLDGFIWLRWRDRAEYEGPNFWDEITCRPFWLEEHEVQNYILLLDRHDLEKSHGESFGSIAMQNGAL